MLASTLSVKHLALLSNNNFPSLKKTIMQENNITDVEFKDVPAQQPEAAADVKQEFNPVEYLSQALLNAGHPEPTAWAKDIDPQAVTHEEENKRIFFTNRALHLYLAEQDVPDNITVRMTLADGVGATKWSAIIDKAIVPWIMGKFDDKGKLKEESVAEQPVVEEGATTTQNGTTFPEPEPGTLTQTDIDSSNALGGPRFERE